ncbi:XrtA/PEP-CTERM system histidine kinase PrsK [Chitinimonas sp. BJB300]|uniref:XrtA/PEP-CTERM system histidine kinase PrsK n=1 Tax=Chitinimonas sp. BJB300 TaxID=1559339 RepID=UPI000C0F4752|nr:XrtA/PEP-CTERM system histidine kinase PrsK [Chitinimonas sp. BJB300]PHV13359.1 PEP-CTERM system histidine kinase PrsK [Chitinimonas sp. BJB300]TSJ85274.1 PEP-CTERM system histidine kinase PrsK [Chitinimonas sp. BJB300]
MNAHTATVAAWSYGLAGFVYTVFWLYLFNSARNGLRSGFVLCAAGLSALWAWGGVLFGLWGTLLFLLSTHLLDLLRIGAWCGFLLVLLKTEPANDDRLPRRLHYLAGVTVTLVLMGLAVQLLAVFGGEAYSALSAHLALVDSLALSVLTLVLVEQLFRNVAADARWSIKPLCLGVSGVSFFDLYLYSDALLFSHLDADAYSIRGFVHALAAPLIAMSTIRSRDWKARIVLSKRAALQSATLIGVGVYLLLVAGAGYYVRYFGGEWGRALQLAVLFVAMLILGILTLSESIRAKLRVQIGKHFFSYRYDYREQWLRFTQTLSSLGVSSELGQQVVRGLADMVESPAGALWLKDEGAGYFTQAATWNLTASTATEELDSSLCKFLSESGWVINLEEYRSLPGRYDKLLLPAWLIEVPNAWLVIPVGTQTELIGFVVLATARTTMDVNWEVNDLLKTAGRQAGAFLGQMQATEALLEARKFDAFNRMSAFVVHDLKNIVTQLALMLKNAERHKDNPEFQQDMLMTVENAVERMRQLMMQLLEGATPINSPRGVELGEVIRRIQAAKAAQLRKVDIELLERVVARVHEDRIERVIGHIVQNALDATPETGRVWVRLLRQGPHARVEIGDTGHGMSAEFLRERFFKPFQTTKPAGMGIGAYESFQYVQELDGKVLVDSVVDKGTQISLLLPLFESTQYTDNSLTPSEAK